MSGPVGGGSGRDTQGGTRAARPGGSGAPGGFGPGGRRRGPMGGGFGPGHGLMMPAEKPQNFRGTFRRLLGELRPERPRILLVMVVALISTAGTVFGPKILGNGINKLMDGLVGKELGQFLPAGHHPRPGGRRLSSRATARWRTWSPATNAVPGVGVDFGALGMVLLGLPALYLAATFFSWIAWYTMAGVSQRTVYRLRRDVDQKLGRLPLKYFDTHPRGDTLSRVTNDIDNIANTLQQSLTQIITSVATIVGVLAMMFWISPMLAAISLLVLPVAAVATMLIARRSQKQFAAQWERTGILNGHVEESHTGHSIVKSFGHQEDAIRRFDEENERVYEASFKAQFISGIIMPTMNFVSNLNYVAIGVLGGVQVAIGIHVAWRRPGLHPVLALVHAADHPDGQHRQPAAVHDGLGRARLRAARRARGDPRPDSAGGPGDVPPATSRSKAWRSATSPRSRSSTTSTPTSAPARCWPSSAPPAPARPRWSTC